LSAEEAFRLLQQQHNENHQNVWARFETELGIRGLAICLVLSCHSFFSVLWNLPHHPYMAHLIDLGRLTWSGVDLFFVLSGFLIGGILLDAAKSENYFAPFYIRRAHRILPLYAVVLILVFSITYLYHRFGATGLWSVQQVPPLYYPTFLQNFWMARHGAGGSYTLGVTWSLAVEEQFYLTLPLIIRYVSRPRLWWIVGGMVMGAPLLRILLYHSFENGVYAGYVLMPCRADALGLGIAAALLKRSSAQWSTIVRLSRCVNLTFAAVAAVLAAVLLSGLKSFTAEAWGLEYTLLAVFYFLLLMSVLLNRRFEALFCLRPLRYMGIIAYGLYLLHYPFLAGARDLSARLNLRQSGWVLLSVSAFALVSATAVAAISWRYLEKPLIQCGHRYRYGRRTEQAHDAANGSLTQGSVV
jgi:peptidoglycan/LPS O-acetylase OafA/YrhL